MRLKRMARKGEGEEEVGGGEGKGVLPPTNTQLTPITNFSPILQSL